MLRAFSYLTDQTVLPGEIRTSEFIHSSYEEHRPRLRNDDVRAYLRFRSGAGHALRREVIVLADVFEQFRVLPPSKKEAAGPRRGISAGIVGGALVWQRAELGPGESLDQVTWV